MKAALFARITVIINEIRFASIFNVSLLISTNKNQSTIYSIENLSYRVTENVNYLKTRKRLFGPWRLSAVLRSVVKGHLDSSPWPLSNSKLSFGFGARACTAASQDRLLVRSVLQFQESEVKTLIWTWTRPVLKSSSRGEPTRARA